MNLIRIAFVSCCCFIGIPTADHELQGALEEWAIKPHYLTAATRLSHASQAENAYRALTNLPPYFNSESRDAQRRRRLIPMILSELKRRMRECATVEAVKEQELIGVAIQTTPTI